MFRMPRTHLSNWLLLVAVAEFGAILLSFYAGLYFSWVKFGWKLEEIVDALPSALFYAVVLQTTVFALGAYDRENIRKYVETSIRIFIAFVIALGILTILFYSLPYLTIWRSIIISAMLVAFVLILLIRRIAIHAIDLDVLKRRIVVVGVGKQAAQIETLLQSSKVTGFNSVGYIDYGGVAPKVPAPRVIPRVNSLLDFAIKENIDEIVVALVDRRQGLPNDALSDCKLRGVSVVDYMAFFSCETGRLDLDMINPSWFVFSNGFRGNSSYRIFKRVVDVTVSLALLIITLPLIILSAIAIRLTSPGPVLLRQTRVGLNGEPFTLLKFRTMVADAEQDGIPRWASQNDSRITAVGSLLRRTRADEIPQLLNVLKGNMSLVGPRPERPHFVKQLAEEVPFYDHRHALKPGLTGWAQLYHHYAASTDDAKRKLEYDLYYLTHCGFFLDFLIILQTVRVVIWPNGVR